MSFLEEEGNLFDGMIVFVSPSAKVNHNGKKKTTMEVKKTIARQGGLVVVNTNTRVCLTATLSNLTCKVNYLVCGELEDLDEEEWKLAEANGMSAINVSFFFDSMDKGKLLNENKYIYTVCFLFVCLLTN